MLSRRRFIANSIAGSLALPFRNLLASPADDSHAKKPIMIDSHVHVFQPSREFPYAKGAQVKLKPAPVEELIGLMRANGVSRTVIIQIIYYKWDNSYLASVLKRYPTLFHGVCRVNPEDPAAPDHLSRLTHQGFRVCGSVRQLLRRAIGFADP